MKLRGILCTFRLSLAEIVKRRGACETVILFERCQKFSVRNLVSVRLVVAVTKLSDTLRSSGKSDIWCSV